MQTLLFQSSSTMLCKHKKTKVGIIIIIIILVIIIIIIIIIIMLVYCHLLQPSSELQV